MRRADKEILTAKEHADALGGCCAACNAKTGDSCVDAEGRPREPHKVRIKVGRWATARTS